MFDSIYLRLQHIHRFSNQNLTIVDTDADHTIRMQLMILELYRKAPYFDLQKATFKALVHDLDEVCMCDVPRNIKYYDDKIHAEVERVAQELMNESGINEEMRGYIRDSKDDTTEGWIVKLLDPVDAFKVLVDQAWTQNSKSIFEQAEISLGHISYIFKNLPDYIDKNLISALAGTLEECKRRLQHVREKAFF